MSNSSYVKIITIIHEKFGRCEPFALRDLAVPAETSTASVVRVLKILQGINLVRWTPKANAGRHYHIHPNNWPKSLNDALVQFEYAKALKLVK